MIEVSSLENMLANSFKNFHTKGFDYLCLKRSPQYTVKIYFLDGDASQLPEVVNPHDHRYLFRTTVLAGDMVDYRFQHDIEGDVYNAFDYMTPLNGGNGFTFRGEERLLKTELNRLIRGDSLITTQEQLHTIGMQTDQTVLMLEQFEDTVPLDKPSSCWSLAHLDTPSADASGLYDRFTEDELISRIATINTLIGGPSDFITQPT